MSGDRAAGAAEARGDPGLSMSARGDSGGGGWVAGRGGILGEPPTVAETSTGIFGVRGMITIVLGRRQLDGAYFGFWIVDVVHFHVYFGWSRIRVW